MHQIYEELIGLMIEEIRKLMYENNSKELKFNLNSQLKGWFMTRYTSNYKMVLDYNIVESSDTLARCIGLSCMLEVIRYYLPIKYFTDNEDFETKVINYTLMVRLIEKVISKELNREGYTVVFPKEIESNVLRNMFLVNDKGLEIPFDILTTAFFIKYLKESSKGREMTEYEKQISQSYCMENQII